MSPGRLIPWLAFLLMRPIAKEVGGGEKREDKRVRNLWEHLSIGHRIKFREYKPESY